METEERNFGNDVDLLNYLWNNHQQTLDDEGLTFKFQVGFGHVEFYKFGPEMVAVPIYHTRMGQRLELLCVGPYMPKKYIDLCVREMISMINRKLSIPKDPVRRIKL